MAIDERQVRALIRDELRRLLGRLVEDDCVYSTRNGCAPPGYSRDTWRCLARRIGVKRGRYYVVTAEHLAAHERGETVKPANDPQPSTWTPADAAEAVGLRKACGSR